MKDTFILLTVTLLFCSCRTNYGNANFSDESAIFLKPSYRNAILEEGEYISGSYNKSVAITNNAYETSNFGSFSYNKGLTKKNATYAYGGFLHAGKITFTEKNLEKFNTDENFNPTESILQPEDFFYLGGGISGEIELNLPFKYIDWRIIGFKTTITYEASDYSDYRKAIVRKSYDVWDESLDDGIFVSDKKATNLNYDDFSINISGTSSLIFKLKNADLGWVNSMGIGHQILTTSSTIYYSENKFTGFMGLHSSVQGIIFRTGVAYRLK